MSDTFRKESRLDWHATGIGVKPTTEQLTLGCLQRIADASELMAKRYADLIGDKERAETSRDYWRREAERMARSNNALRGAITKLKRKAGQA